MRCVLLGRGSRARALQRGTASAECRTLAERLSGAHDGSALRADARTTAAGLYRIALDQPIWVDVVAEGTPVRSRDFQGRSGCSAPHKIVEFVLPAKVALTIQLSSGSGPTVRVAVLAAPPS